MKEYVRTQLQEAKSKAKQVIQKNVEESKKEIEKKQEQIDLLSEQLKNLEEDQKQQTATQECSNCHKFESMKEALELAESKIVALERASTEKVNGHANVESLEKQVQQQKDALASKQAELTKVREKAKTMLKELNNEKSKVESDFEKEKLDARKRISKLEDNLRSAKKGEEVAGRELAGAMNTVSDLQKSLRQNKKELETSRAEESATKEKLHELEQELHGHRDGNQAFVAEKEATIARLRDENEEMQQRLAAEQGRAERLNIQLADLTSEKKDMEAAEGSTRVLETQIAELTENVSDLKKRLHKEQIEKDEQMSYLREEVQTERSRAADLDLKNAQNILKISVLEKSLKEAEEKGGRSCQDHCEKIDTLQCEIEELKSKWRKDKQSADSARRTVEAAMLAYSNSGGPHTDQDEEKAQLKQGNTELKEQVQDLKSMNEMLSEQLTVLKNEIRAMESREERVTRLSDHLQFDYLKNVIVRFLETDDLNSLLPVLANVLCISPEEMEKIKEMRAPKPQRNILRWRS
eukprot:CAMPEP_0198735050 /NCGR_PEP_ID=MMETSP1475-20131203/57009_1 /TAXON_ID= ORGANISM="Unidentified sp., Strain CCMP1999" /NCGR_SAMPLE_ID=MMETSP1475 /ASSEMBLY_ACC=CAM_ASM_001111 /LENGTH=523 /DNA_ID=CAMNT_0044498643 /DNA_START=38 /DNA_END=1609 /DNA_ORIENTATION=+